MKGENMKFRVLIEQDEEGRFVAGVPVLPGCVTQGTTRQEALANVRQAIASYLKGLEAPGVLSPMTQDIVEVTV
jgi:predicted RNase H-like HicB family nuclease